MNDGADAKGSRERAGLSQIAITWIREHFRLKKADKDLLRDQARYDVFTENLRELPLDSTLMIYEPGGQQLAAWKGDRRPPPPAKIITLSGEMVVDGTSGSDTRKTADLPDRGPGGPAGELSR